MLSRIVSLFLTLILVCAGLSAQGQPMAQASFHNDPAMAQAVGPVPDDAVQAVGAVSDTAPEEEQASQPLIELLSDIPGLIQRCHEVPAPALAMAPPHPYDAASLSPPYLDGLQRPPCASGLLA